MQPTTPEQQAIAALSGPERKAARVATGKSQQALSNECGVAIQTIRTWELGVLPQAHRAAAYAKALRLPVLAKTGGA